MNTLTSVCFDIDPTDSTQVVKTSPVSEARPAQPMKQVNPQNHGTYVRTIHTYRQSLQPSTTTQAVSTHIILQMERTVTSYKTQSSLLFHT